VAYIYCNYKEENEQTLANLIASLWLQLVVEKRKNRAFTERVKALHEKHNQYPKNTRPSLDEVFGILSAEALTFSRIFIVVDGLDECPERSEDLTPTRPNLVKKLRALLKANIMFTSRPLDISVYGIRKPIELTINADVSDVMAYVRRRIADEPVLSKWVHDNAELGRSITETIATKASKM
jgi:hypothetical protein